MRLAKCLVSKGQLFFWAAWFNSTAKTASWRWVWRVEFSGAVRVLSRAIVAQRSSSSSACELVMSKAHMPASRRGLGNRSAVTFNGARAAGYSLVSMVPGMQGE